MKGSEGNDNALIMYQEVAEVLSRVLSAYGQKEPYLESLHAAFLLKRGDVSDALEIGLNLLVQLPYFTFLWDLIGMALKKYIAKPLSLDEAANLFNVQEHPLFALYLQSVYQVISADCQIDLDAAWDASRFVALQKSRLAYHRHDNDLAKEILEGQLNAGLEGLEVLSDIHFMNDDQDGLRYLALKTQKMSPYHPISSYIMGNYLASQGEHEKAISVFKDAASKSPFLDNAWILVAQQYLELKKPEKAIEAYLRAAGNRIYFDNFDP